MREALIEKQQAQMEHLYSKNIKFMGKLKIELDQINSKQGVMLEVKEALQRGETFEETESESERELTDKYGQGVEL